jgi:uncharacterized repeat protein (TIGR03803 family)
LQILDSCGTIDGLCGGIGMSRGNLSKLFRLLCCTLIALLWAPATAWCQTEKVLYSFGSTQADGYAPQAGLLMDSHSNLFSTTWTGGTGTNCPAGCGTIWELLPNGDGTWAHQVLHSFNNYDGAYASGTLVTDGHGNLYGATAGGQFGTGVVFELSPQAGGSWIETVLHAFAGQGDGAFANPGVTLDGFGNLYGSTLLGGAVNYDGGTVYKIRLQPLPVETILHSFGLGLNLRDGDNPDGTLLLDGRGELFGVTENGGLYQKGTIFKLAPVGPRWAELPLYSFQGSAHNDGSLPQAGLIADAQGNLYGSTVSGGPPVGTCTEGCGTVYKLSRQADGTWAETVLYAFQAGLDGNAPSGLLTMDRSGNLYGTTSEGGYRDGYLGFGMVYKLTPGADGHWTETVLHRFPGGLDGAYPLAGVILDANGNLYGTTQQGGTNNIGTVFEITP